ncbi:MAG: hypothetical protein KUG78_10760 [Kangiellaceae bacterium]|nr:hypothetical protein [Kangiellaceae bacterium]
MWRRKGWITPIAFIFPMAAVQLVVNFSLGEQYYLHNTWPKIVAVLSGVVVVAYLGYYLNYAKREKINENSRVEKLSDSHTMFFIPVEYWSIILAVFFTYVILK